MYEKFQFTIFLDKVLSFLKESGLVAPSKQNLPEFTDYENEILQAAFKKLEIDGYAYSVPHRVLTNAPTFHISFEGLLFMEQGGYKQKSNIEEINLKNLETDIRIRKRNERWTVRGAISAGVGAVGYLLLELYRFFCQ